jgi:hypothetical protein
MPINFFLLLDGKVAHPRTTCEKLVATPQATNAPTIFEDERNTTLTFIVNDHINPHSNSMKEIPCFFLRLTIELGNGIFSSGNCSPFGENSSEHARVG